MLPPPLPPSADESSEEAVTYEARTSAFDPRTTYTTTARGLKIETESREADGPPPPTVPRVIPWSEFVMMRLRYFPTRVQPHRYDCLLTRQSGAVLRLTNECYRAPMSFDNHSDDYRSFVEAVAGRLRQKHPPARFVTGSSPAGYYGSIVFATVSFALLAVVLLITGPLTWGVAAIKLGILLFFLPALWRWVRKNRPGTFDPTAIPDDILPRRSSSDS